jgi:hypothetical protein
MLTGTCHCGAVQISIPRKPRRLTSCNCSICRRHAGLWGYFKRREVKVSARRGALQSYLWGDRCLRLMRCATCGCVTHWVAIGATADSRTGVNLRNFEPGDIAGIRVRRIDGARTWQFLD